MQRVASYSGPGRLLRLGGGPHPPVLLTHGTFSTAETCLPLAQRLAQDRPVYIIEWRGRGRGRKPGAFDFCDLATGEIAQALNSIARPVHLVAHSGGGLAMCFALLDPAVRARTLSLTMLATQGTSLTQAAWHRYAAVRALELVGRVLGRWPARLTGLGPSDESARLLSQWVAFNRARRIITPDGRDLFAALPALNLPVFALAGAADQTIARPEGCRALAQAFGTHARYHLCQAETDGEDFTHARLIRSRAAAAHVWPRIAAFLEETDRLFPSGVASD